MTRFIRITIFVIAAVPALLLPFSLILLTFLSLISLFYNPAEFYNPVSFAFRSQLGFLAIYATLFQIPIYILWVITSKELDWRMRTLWTVFIFGGNMFTIPWFLYCKFTGSTHLTAIMLLKADRSFRRRFNFKRFQFSLRSLLVFMLLMGVILGWTGKKVLSIRKQRSVLAELEKVGGEGYSKFGNVNSLFFLSGNSLTDKEMIQLEEFCELESIHVFQSDITDVGLIHLQGLTYLKTLVLSDTSVTNDGLVYLKVLSNLHWLSLSKNEITDEGIIHLGKLKSLKRLDLCDTQITDAALEHLMGLSNLETLDLRGTKVTAAGIKKLQQLLPNCEIHWDEG